MNAQDPIAKGERINTQGELGIHVGLLDAAGNLYIHGQAETEGRSGASSSSGGGGGGSVPEAELVVENVGKISNHKPVGNKKLKFAEGECVAEWAWLAHKLGGTTR